MAANVVHEPLVDEIVDEVSLIEDERQGSKYIPATSTKALRNAASTAEATRQRQADAVDDETESQSEKHLASIVGAHPGSRTKNLSEEQHEKTQEHVQEAATKEAASKEATEKEKEKNDKEVVFKAQQKDGAAEAATKEAAAKQLAEHSAEEAEAKKEAEKEREQKHKEDQEVDNA